MVRKNRADNKKLAKGLLVHNKTKLNCPSLIVGVGHITFLGKTYLHI